MHTVQSEVSELFNDRETNNISLDELKVIVGPIASRYNVKRVYLFGSRARGDNGPDSDYDFFLVLDYDVVSLSELGSFMYDLETALGQRVDFAYDSMSENFKSSISEDMKLIYG